MSKIQIYSFRLHVPGGKGSIQPIKGTADGIRKYMMVEPMTETEEDVDTSLIDVYGFRRGPEHMKPSSATS